MNRRDLAETSGVSERFLAQLETGTGNISVLRLRHVALALGKEPHEVIRSASGEPASAPAHRRIALIGLRGAGKTTLGRLAAQRLGLEFIELTERIEQKSGLALNDIFNLYGADGYRRLEQQELRRVIDETQACILAPAGGVTENPETFELLLAQFRTVWLTADPDEHMQRVVAQGDLRPMRGHDEALDSLKTILATRARDYARAGDVVDTSGLTVEAALARLMPILEGRN